MGLRFSRRIKILPGVRLNVGLRGASLSVGPRGASVTMGKRGVHANVGIPGTGLSYRSRVDRPANRGSAAARNRDTSPPPPTTLQVRHNPDGTLALLDENGWSLDERTAQAARAAYREQLADMLAERAGELASETLALSVHLDTPAPGRSNAPPPYPVAKPARPADPRTIDPGSHQRKAAEAEWSSYMERLALWRAAKAEHEKTHGVTATAAAVEALISKRLERLSWPRETLVSLEVRDGGRLVVADVDLPEIESMPASSWSVDRRDLRLRAKPLSQTAQRKLYLRHVHAVLFRIIGELFAASSDVGEVRIAGYTQRVSTATGVIEDEYVLAVRVERQAWATISFTSLDAVDPVDALARFDRNCASDARAQMRAITPVF